MSSDAVPGAALERGDVGLAVAVQLLELGERVRVRLPAVEGRDLVAAGERGLDQGVRRRTSARRAAAASRHVPDVAGLGGERGADEAVALGLGEEPGRSAGGGVSSTSRRTSMSTKAKRPCSWRRVTVPLAVAGRRDLDRLLAARGDRQARQRAVDEARRARDARAPTPAGCRSSTPVRSRGPLRRRRPRTRTPSVSAQPCGATYRVRPVRKLRSGRDEAPAPERVRVLHTPLRRP